MRADMHAPPEQGISDEGLGMFYVMRVTVHGRASRLGGAGRNRVLWGRAGRAVNGGAGRGRQEWETSHLLDALAVESWLNC